MSHPRALPVLATAALAVDRTPATAETTAEAPPDDPARRVLPLLAEADAAQVPLETLDTLWFQLTGTLCNIACRHCFITCGPQADRVPMMTPARVEALLAEARALGVREFYFTGGEPLLHPEFFELAARVLSEGPLSVLTNGILIDDAAARRLRGLFDEARYSFDLRVSLDGTDAASNDPVRGRGTFAAICAGLRALAGVGLSPVITVVEHDEALRSDAARAAFLDFARALGLPRPRVKFLPLLAIGREPRRAVPDATLYPEEQALAAALHPDALLPEALAALQCRTSRLATADGVYTCPILLDAPAARMGRDLRDALGPLPLRFAACHTCVTQGLSCRT